MYQKLAEHYQVAVLPARPRKPKDKAKAELGVQVVERWILARLRKQAFFSLAELNHCIRILVNELNERPVLLVSQEKMERGQRKQSRLLQKARLRLEASVHDIDYQPSRNLGRARIAQLSQNEWIAKGQNRLITGPCGCGKTYMGCALGHNACQQGYSGQYWRLSRLLPDLMQSRADGSYQKQLSVLAKTQLLILDDWALEPLAGTQRNDLLELMDDRYGKTSTVVISQLPTDEWYGSVGGNTLADAILDRLMHNPHRLDMKGESMRKRRAQVDQSEQKS